MRGAFVETVRVKRAGCQTTHTHWGSARLAPHANLSDQLAVAHVLRCHHLREIAAAFAELGLPAPILRVETDFGSTSLFELVRGTEMLCIAGATGNSTSASAGQRPIALRADALDLGRRIGVMSREGAYLSPLAQRMVDILEAHMQ